MKTEQNTRLGIILMSLTSLVFSIQDGISRHLGGEYNVYMVVMIRFWFFALFVMFLASRQPGGLRAAIATRQPLVQIIEALSAIPQTVARLGAVEPARQFRQSQALLGQPSLQRAVQSFGQQANPAQPFQPVGAGQFRRRRRRGGAQVGGKISDGDVGFVADAGH